jgi:ribosomal peptide maturation radical SAM protein 1
MSDVLLVSMPFGPLFSPSFALSLLKAALAERGIGAEVRYFSLDFAERIGQDFYSDIGTEGRPPLVMLAGEWIFSAALFPPTDGAEESYLREILASPAPQTARGSAPPVTPSRARRLVAARGKAAAFIDACFAEIVEKRPRILGLTSIFQQHVASLALARRVKEALPDTVIVIGGANCEGVMGAETVRLFPFIDAVVSGEGEVVFPELAARVLSGSGFQDLEGVRTPRGVGRDFALGRFGNAPAVPRMDDLPRPDFSDFFRQFEASRFSREWEPSLFYETSRGCWWGERQHCTFCGLNGSSMAFRSKSALRALSELEELARLHPGCDIQVVDNILDMAYFKDFLPMLAERGLGVDLFYETKSNLRKEQVRLLRRAGIRRIQPGIESLSDSVLKLMRKGVTALQNIQLLKWCREFGVEPHWNVLWGFPGEDPAEYERAADLVPALVHLPPPVGFSDIRLDRFSPNFFDAEALGFRNITPVPSYRHVYPGLPPAALANLAYFFSFDYREPRDVGAYVGRLARELAAWRRSGRRGESDLFSVDLGTVLLVWDLRPEAPVPLSPLRELDRLLVLACDAAVDRRSLVALGADAGFGPEEVPARLAGLAARGFVVSEKERTLALPLPLGDYVPAPRVLAHLDRIVKRIGTPVGPRPRRRPHPSLAVSDFVLDPRGDLVVRNAFRIPLGARGGGSNPREDVSLKDAHPGRPMEVR